MGPARRLDWSCCKTDVLFSPLLSNILNWQRRKVSTKAEKTIETMAVYGNVGVFDEKVESFEDYRDRMDCSCQPTP